MKLEVTEIEYNMALNGLAETVDSLESKYNGRLDDYDNAMFDSDHYGNPDDLIEPIEHVKELLKDYVNLLFKLGDSVDYFGGIERHRVVAIHRRMNK